MSGTLEFADGQESQAFAIPILPAADDDSTKTLGLVLVNPSAGAALGVVQTATLSLLGTAAAPLLSVDDAEARPGEDAVFTVRLSKPSDQTVTVGYATVDGTARGQTSSAADSLPPSYVPATGRLSFAPGESRKVIAVRTLAGPAWGSTLHSCSSIPKLRA